VVLQEANLLQLVLSPDTSVGTVLDRLAPRLAEIVHVRELQTPLRDLLAQMYARGEARKEEES
jgi:hypothetical protein